ncbi:ROK family transcriptional regulator [Paenibacillus sp. MBLB4367]|uniref:ROK family transcriptional regulator n=1 Tax=Paenibacillus sp. MBLB4367 TaxID=3384767 RepID=UPI0039082307
MKSIDKPGQPVAKNATQQKMKESNKALLLHLLYHDGPMSRVELARQTKLSPTTVSVLIDEAIREGVVYEKGTSGSGVGRKQIILDIQADSGYSLGVDLSYRAARIVLLNLRGEVIGSEKSALLIGEVQLRQTLPGLIGGFLARQGVSSDKIRHLGVSLPGVIDEERGCVTESTYLKLKEFPLAHWLSDSTGMQVKLVNDLDAHGFAERFSGTAQGFHTIVYILLDYGVGAGILIDNRIYRGSGGEAGRMSAFVPYTTGVLAESLQRAHSEPFKGLTPEETIGKFVELGLQREEPFALLLTEMTEKISAYCGSALQVLNPELLVLNGWITHNETYLHVLKERIAYYEASLREAAPIRSSYWKEFGSAVGAATIGLDALFGSKSL